MIMVIHFSKHGLIGILIRISEKIDRSVNITNNEITLIDNESMRDTLIDLHNYSATGNYAYERKK